MKVDELQCREKEERWVMEGKKGDEKSESDSLRESNVPKTRVAFGQASAGPK